MRTAIVWGSSTGQTEQAAGRLHELLNGVSDLCVDVNDFSADDILGCDVVIIGVSTWDIGEIQCDWEDRIIEMEDHDWSSTHVAFFGTGDGLTYDDTFVDAFGLIWERIVPKGAKLLGKWPTEGYSFADSASLTDDRSHFLGLPLDNDNEPQLTDARLVSWAEKLRGEIAALTADEQPAAAAPPPAE
ncbi:MAG: flavodoxin [Myxococcota bacterium]